MRVQHLRTGASRIAHRPGQLRGGGKLGVKLVVLGLQ